MIVYIYDLYLLSTIIFANYPPLKKTIETRIIKNIFNKNGKRCRDVKTQNVCEQGQEVNVEPKIKQPLTYNPT